MLELKVGIAYEADIRTAKAVLERVYREHPMVKKDEDIKVFADSLGDSSVVLGIRGWGRDIRLLADEDGTHWNGSSCHLTRRASKFHTTRWMYI